MAKLLKDSEMLDIIKRAIVDSEIDESNQYKNFLAELGALICDHFGGEPGEIDHDENDPLGWAMQFHLNDCVPDNGGVFAKYHRSIVWKNGEESEACAPVKKFFIGENVYDNKTMTIGIVGEIRENGDLLLKDSPDFGLIYEPHDWERLENLKKGMFYVGLSYRSHSGRPDKIKHIVSTKEEAIALHDALLEEDDDDIVGSFYIEGFDEYCVTAVFDNEPDANHTKWFPEYDEAKAYIETLGDVNAAIGKRLSVEFAQTHWCDDKEVCFIFDDGTESVYEGGEIDSIYKGLPLAIYI